MLKTSHHSDASASPAAGAPELRTYSVAAGTAVTSAKALQTMFRSLRVLSLPSTNEIMVLADADEHSVVEMLLQPAYVTVGGK